jgi:TFIIF-interacting CTD phosphatase-like protein
MYHMWSKNYSYLVKIRPFFKEFILQSLHMYDLYFYTAAVRSYGVMVLEILKLEIGELLD